VVRYTFRRTSEGACDERRQARCQRRAARGAARREKGGTHPLGATTGAIGGAVAGALVGLAAGPVGSLVGLVGGAVQGGALGASTDTGPVIDVAAEERYWRENFASRPCVPSAGWGKAKRAHQASRRRRSPD
jgi:hypothetical protein